MLLNKLKTLVKYTIFCHIFIDVLTCNACVTHFQVSRSFDMAVGEPEDRNAGRVGGLELDERRDQRLRRERSR